MSINIKKILPLLGIVAAVFCFVCFDPMFHGPDDPVYFASTQSIAKNLDMNLAPALISHGSAMWITQTGNYPDFHNNGAIVFWLPAYVFGQSVYCLAELVAPFWAQARGAEMFSRCALSGMNIVLGLALCFFCFQFCRKFVSALSSAVAVGAISCATVFFHYLLFDTGNANIPAALFCVGMIWALFDCEKFNFTGWALYGLFVSLALAVKSELWLYFVLSLFVFCRFLFKRRITPRAMLCFFAGFAVVLGLRMINAYIRFGTLHMEEVIYFRSFFEYQDTYSFNGLFSRFRGILYTSPVLLLSVCGFFTSLIFYFRKMQKDSDVNKEKSLLIVLLGSCALLKLIAVGRIFSPAGDGLSFRVLIAELPVFILLFALFFEFLPRVGKIAAVVFCVVAGLWNFIVYSGYMSSLEWHFLSLDSVSRNLCFDAVAASALYVFSFKGLGVKVVQLLVLSIIAGFLFFVKRKAGLLFLKTVCMRSAVVFCLCVYFVATSLNLGFNSRNTKQLKDSGFYKNCSLMETSAFDMTRLEREQHLYTLMNMYRFLLFTGQNTQAQKLYAGRIRTFGNAQIPVDRFALPFSKLAERCMQNGDYDSAEVLLLKTKEYAAHNWEALLLLGDILMLGGKSNEAVAVYKDALEKNPSASPVLTRLAEFYEKAGRYELAAKYIKKDLSLNPGNITHYKTLAVFYRKQGLEKKELSALETVLALDPADKETQKIYLKLLVASGNYARALDVLGRAEDNLRTLTLKAEIFRAQGKPDLEINVLEQMRSHDAGLVSVLKRLSELYFDNGENNNALNCALAMEKIASSPASVRLIGKIYFESGDFEKALPYLAKTVSITPRDLESLENLARSQYVLGRTDAALENCKTLVSLGVHKPEIFFRLGELFFRQGNNKEAIKNLQLAGDDENSLRLLADVFRADGQTDRARAIYLQLIAAFPDALDIRGQKAEMEYLMGNYDVAAKEYSGIRKLRGKDRLLSRRTISALAKAGRTEDAAVLAREQLVVSGKKEKASLLLELGEFYLDLGNLEDAEKYFKEAIAGDSNSVAAYKLLAGLYAKQGNNVMAADCYRTITHLSPSPDNWLFFARYSRACNDSVSALSGYEKAFAVENMTATFDDRLDYAEELLRVGKFKEAETAAETLLNEGGELSGGLCDLLVRVYDELALDAKKIDVLERFINAVPDDFHRLIALARAYHGAGKSEAACALFSRAESLRPLSLDVLADYALALIERGAFADAEKVYTQMLDRDSKNARAMDGLILVYDVVGNSQKRINTLLKYLKAFPDSYQHKAKLAWMYEKNGQMEKAADVYAQLAAMNPMSPQPLWKLGDMYMSDGQYGKAREIYERALALGPAGRLESLRKLAAVCDKLGDIETRLVVLDEIMDMSDTTSSFLIEYAEQLFKADKVDEALSLCQKLIKNEGISRPVCRLMSVLYERQNKTEKQIEIIEQYLRKFPDDYEMILKLASAYKRDLRLSDAALAFLRAFEINSESVEPLWMLGDMHMRSGNFSAAREIYEKAYASGSGGRLESLQKLMAVCSKLGDDGARLKYMREVMSLVEPTDKIRLDFARQLAKAGQGDEALKLCREFTQKGLFVHDVTFLILRIYEDSGKYDKGIQVIKQQLEEEKNNYLLLMSLARLYEKTGRLEKALDTYKEIISIVPQTAHPYWKLGDLYMSQGRFEDARDIYKQALDKKMTQGRVETLRKLAAVYDKLGDGAGRLDMLRQIMDESGVSSPRMIEYARTLVAVGDFKEAATWYEGALAKNPEDAQAEYEYGQLCMRMGLFEKARKSLAKQFLLRPKSEDLCNELIKLSERIGDKQSVVKYLEQLFSINPMAPVSKRKHLADVYVGLGRNKEAARCYQAVIAREPGDEYSLKRLAWIYENEKDYKQALLYLKKLEESGHANDEILAKIKTLNEQTSATK